MVQKSNISTEDSMKYEKQYKSEDSTVERSQFTPRVSIIG